MASLASLTTWTEICPSMRSIHWNVPPPVARTALPRPTQSTVDAAAQCHTARSSMAIKWLELCMATGEQAMERTQIPLPQHADNKFRGSDPARSTHQSLHSLLPHFEVGNRPPKTKKKREKEKLNELNISNLLMFPSLSLSSSLGKFFSVEKCQMSLWVKLTQIYDD